MCLAAGKCREISTKTHSKPDVTHYPHQPGVATKLTEIIQTNSKIPDHLLS